MITMHIPKHSPHPVHRQSTCSHSYITTEYYPYLKRVTDYCTQSISSRVTKWLNLHLLNSSTFKDFKGPGGTLTIPMSSMAACCKNINVTALTSLQSISKDSALHARQFQKRRTVLEVGVATFMSCFTILCSPAVTHFILTHVCNNTLVLVTTQLIKHVNSFKIKDSLINS